MLTTSSNRLDCSTGWREHTDTRDLRPCAPSPRGAATAPTIAKPMNARRLVTRSSRRPLRLRRPARVGGDRLGEVLLAVVLQLVYDLLLGAGLAIGACRVSVDAVSDMSVPACVARGVM